MLQYLVILLDDTSVAYCHANNPLKERNLIPLDTLRKAILWGMKENLMIQFVYPNYELPETYNEIIESIDHIKIGRDVAVYNEIPTEVNVGNVTLRLTIEEFIAKISKIATILPQLGRLNICLTNIEDFNDNLIGDYKEALTLLNDLLVNLYKSDRKPQVNILTERMNLKQMHNCGAGVTNITIAPNGKFYLCPAFYYDEKMGVYNRLNHRNPSYERSVGNLESGLHIPNQQLLNLDHAPLCRICDAFHCNRCIWLNQKLTWDINTPSHQQCVIAHLERNAARDLQIQFGTKNLSKENIIKEIEYLDPFEVRKKY